MNGPRRRRKCDDLSAGKSRSSLARAADLKDSDIFIGLEAEPFQQHPRRNVRGAADATDADALSFELLRRADRLVNDQFIGQRVDETADGDQIGAADHRVSNTATGDIADLDRTRD